MDRPLKYETGKCLMEHIYRVKQMIQVLTGTLSVVGTQLLLQCSTYRPLVLLDPWRGAAPLPQVSPGNLSVVGTQMKWQCSMCRPPVSSDSRKVADPLTCIRLLASLSVISL
ncbi:hypothetical protein FKM82_023027 [Ascaphus truei]